MSKARVAPKIREVHLLDVALLLWHIERGAAHPDVGYEHADKTKQRLMLDLRKVTTVHVDVIQDALWSANLLDEQKEFWHPDGIPFAEWVKRFLCDGEMYDREFCLIRERK